MGNDINVNGASNNGRLEVIFSDIGSSMEWNYVLFMVHTVCSKKKEKKGQICSCLVKYVNKKIVMNNQLVVL